MQKREKQNNRNVGTYYEQVAATYLKQTGYTIVEKNYRCRLGEIDIIAREEGLLIFIEVKYRKEGQYGYPREAVNFKKQQRIRRVASYYIKNLYGYESICRFDVIEILQGKLTHLKAAF